MCYFSRDFDKSDKKSVWLLVKCLRLFGFILHFELDFRFGFECLFDRFGCDSAVEVAPRASVHGIEIHGVVLFDVDFIH